jgi:hypothetical protein
MYLDYLPVLIPLIALLVYVITQVLIFRYVSKLGLLKSQYLGFVIGFFGLLLFEYCYFLIHPTVRKELIAIFIMNLITYISLGYCYFHFINLGETARRIRILRELYNSANGLSMEEIITVYNASEILDRRINRLIKNKQIICRDGKYFINKGLVLFMARVMIGGKLLLFGKRRTDE